MTRRIDRYHRLESLPGDRDMQNGFAARVHDPLWLLARQWQMGEHQGENASSPVQIACTITTTPIEPLGGNADFDPTIVPAEALVESELDDWWTMGRRVRVGDLFKGNPVATGAKGVRFLDPPPPYDAFVGRLDGRALWLSRSRLLIPDAAFGPDAPLADSPFAWSSRHLNYSAEFNTAERPLAVADHHGGPMDWYSADAATDTPLVDQVPVLSGPAIPVPLEYPGAPHSRFWEIEDANVDIGGYPPDSAHFATMLLVDLVYSHGDDWFVFPITANAGNILTIRSLEVTDAFGKTYSSEQLGNNGGALYPGLHAPEDFSLFRCDGLRPESLVLWPVAESPLESAPIERVQFGVDEHSNVLWALERIVDSREVSRNAGEADAEHPLYPPAIPVSDLQGERIYSYVPAVGIESRWHPYDLDWEAERGPAYVQKGLADYSLQLPRPMPHPQALVLKADIVTDRHQVAATAMARGGLELERRWQLARDMQGRPVLWVQRQRRSLRNPPARTIRFDVMQEGIAQN